MLRATIALVAFAAPVAADVPDYPTCIQRLADTHAAITKFEAVRDDTFDLFVGAPAEITEGTDATWIGPSADAAAKALEAYADDLATLCEALRRYSAT